MDARDSYTVSLATPDRLNLSMEYEHCLLRADSDLFKKLTVRPNGEITLAENSGAYKLSMVMDEGYHPTHWHSVSASGKDGGNVSLRYVESQKGWLLTAGSLQNVTVTANNYKNFPKVRFSTTYNTVLIYEIDEDTIGIAVDTNNDGTFERTIARGMRGDVNADKEVSVEDAQLVLTAYTEATLSGNPMPLTLEQQGVADVNDDGEVDVSDAQFILIYYAETTLSGNAVTWEQITGK